MARKSSHKPASASKTKQTSPRHGIHMSRPFYSDLLGVASGLLSNRRGIGAAKISSLADAARNLGEDLSELPYARNFVSGAADQMETLSNYVSESTLEEMKKDVTTLVKRHPVSTAVFAVALGYGLTRLSMMQDTSRRTSRSASPGVRRAASKKHSVATNRKRANGKDTSHESAHAR